MWKACVSNKVEVNCPLCDLIIPQTLSQKFHECHKAKLAWALVASIIYWLKHPLVQVQGTMQKPYILHFSSTKNFLETTWRLLLFSHS